MNKNCIRSKEKILNKNILESTRHMKGDNFIFKLQAFAKCVITLFAQKFQHCLHLLRKVKITYPYT